eukprot:g3480.t1
MQPLALIASIKSKNSFNLACKHFDFNYFNGLSSELQLRFLRCVRSGFENAESSIGCYAMSPKDYDTFAEFFDKVIQDYHNGTPESRHITDWDISKKGPGGDGILDVAKLGLDTLSMRVRVGRNLEGFNLPGMMDKAERIKFEKALVPVFKKLKLTYGGKISSISPDWGDGVENPNKISDEEYKALVDAHVMFKDMAADKYLASAGISSDWPYGRGCWQSDDKECIVWFGEEDQLRIMSMKKGTCLNEVFNKLKDLLDTFEAIDGIKFAKSEKYGYITSCPSNLGTGMRASVHVKVPNLTKDGTDAKAKEICKPLELSVRGIGGEHTPIGDDGTIDVSPQARLFIKENEIVEKLYNGVAALFAAEKSASKHKSML